jgi:hypothetical protein
MKKEIAETKLRRDLRASLYSFLLYLAGMAAGFFAPWLGLRLTRLANWFVAEATAGPANCGGRRQFSRAASLPFRAPLFR